MTEETLEELIRQVMRRGFAITLAPEKGCTLLTLAKSGAEQRLSCSSAASVKDALKRILTSKTGWV